jgi:hypothetical protein
MSTEIKKLLQSKDPSDRKLCLTLLEAHLASHPSDSESWYDKACCHDFLGEEREAEPCYARCYELGWRSLPEPEHPSFFVGYGSTLRNNLKLEESVRFLEEGVRHFPAYPALRVFLAFSLHTAGQREKATELLFKSVCDISEKGLGGYDRAIAWYAEHLHDHPPKEDP